MTESRAVKSKYRAGNKREEGITKCLEKFGEVYVWSLCLMGVYMSKLVKLHTLYMCSFVCKLHFNKTVKTKNLYFLRKGNLQQGLRRWKSLLLDQIFVFLSMWNQYLSFDLAIYTTLPTVSYCLLLLASSIIHYVGRKEKKKKKKD